MLTLRPTTSGDLAYVTSWEADPDTAAWLGETGAAWHARALRDPGQEHVTAWAGTSPVGFAVLAGRALLRAVLVRARRDHGAREVWLDVKAHNHRARTLYASVRFAVTRTLPAAVAEADGSRSDLVVMACRLDQGVSAGSPR
jgi:hypothetical protein